jgi:antitoxin (DNA-binding transcriptional repressor) of toxin-antitoxin stability system
MKVVALEGMAMTVAELVDMAQGENVILTRDGQPLASIRNLTGTDWESAALATNPRFQAVIEKSRRARGDQGGIGLADVRQVLGLDAESLDNEPDVPHGSG